MLLLRYFLKNTEASIHSRWINIHLCHCCCLSRLLLNHLWTLRQRRGDNRAILASWLLSSKYIIIFQFRMRVCICMTRSQPLHLFLSRIVSVAVLFSITCNNERAFVCVLISMSKKQPEWLWPPSNGKIVRMHWNSMVPMAWAPSDRGTLTQPERTNQSYLRRLSDQDNNHVIEREGKKKKVPLFKREKWPSSCRWLIV